MIVKKKEASEEWETYLRLLTPDRVIQCQILQHDLRLHWMSW